jgi:hypothetical protein
VTRRRPLAGVDISGPPGGPHLPTLLALLEGPLLEQAVRALAVVPEVLVVTPPAETILAAPAWRCSSGRYSGDPRSG